MQEAWFALAIPCQSGPASYDGLPGLILEVNKNNGEMLTTATNIDFKKLDDKYFERPKKGKKVTRAEYLAIVEEKTKEMGGPAGKGGSFMIIQQN